MNKEQAVDINGVEKKVFFDDSREILDELLKAGIILTDKIDQLPRGNSDQVAYCAYLKNFSVGSAELGHDIIGAAKDNKVLLASIGVRAIVENVIDAAYLSSKPITERPSVALSWFDLANDPNANKSQLDHGNIWKRAAEAGQDFSDLLDGEYSIFSNFVHSTAKRALLQMDDHRQLAMYKAIAATLKAYANILCSVYAMLDEQMPEKLQKQVKGYLDKYQETIIGAQLPLDIQ